ncbi:50S ribosomal protein L4 [Bifidobacterium sp. W8101]|uniref:50S ribosomal protein L4 n=1 Tax=Bifidobacterium TaxID=1678 RepID=UPI0018DBA92C|nr:MULTISPECIES: 50S ribosomal protein L4 [Bifidobacterium]MBI0126516.1 50S ribosomal protein L4 [Bifidobacterium choladohabitans]MBI0128085.1 50S ribosomal protein L4 [Bifidobacterium sp. W8103]MBI0138673.1 50S ribosomal protein L4 [Bifidobacterium sp. W8105]MBI0143095.1 50S ribosomal protein L4 [Bifidobacterium choladohabitans]MBI0147471.1 50S ribosomal protein L4 [Bifidobacterium sp. W8104]
MAKLTLNITDAQGKNTGTVEAPEQIFGIAEEDVRSHVPLIHQVVVAQLAAARQGTHSVKTRSTVSGGGRKPWKQKGTGRARQGSIRAPQWTGGAIVHGPQPRDYSQRTPKKMKAAALRYVLSDRVNAGRVHVVDFGIGETPSTKAAKAALLPLVDNRFTTVVLSRENINEWLSVRNLPTVHVLFADQLNTYDVVTAEDVVFSKDGFDAFLAVKGGAKSETVKEA